MLEASHREPQAYIAAAQSREGLATSLLPCRCAGLKPCHCSWYTVVSRCGGLGGFEEAIAAEPHVAGARGGCTLPQRQKRLLVFPSSISVCFLRFRSHSASRKVRTMAGVVPLCCVLAGPENP